MQRVAANDVVLGVLQNGRGGLATQLKVEHRAARGERVAQVALVDGERDGVLASPVQDARDLAGTAQTAGLTRVGDRALGDRLYRAASR